MEQIADSQLPFGSLPGALPTSRTFAGLIADDMPLKLVDAPLTEKTKDKPTDKKNAYISVYNLVARECRSWYTL
jgi:hypothetical protein